jgi:hypothetical protein
VSDLYLEIRNLLTIFVPIFPTPLLLLASFIVFKAKWEKNCSERGSEREEVVVGLTGLFMGIDFNLQ